MPERTCFHIQRFVTERSYLRASLCKGLLRKDRTYMHPYAKVCYRKAVLALILMQGFVIESPTGRTALCIGMR